MTTTEYSSSATPDPAPLASRLQAALALHQQGRLAEARPVYEAILRDHPGQADALHLLGVLALQSGDAPTAIARINDAIAAFPGNPEFHLNLAMALKTQGRLDEALTCHDRALALDPHLLNGHLGRASLLKTMGRLTEAVESYEHAIAIRPDIAEVHFNLGNLHLGLGQLAPAAACYERALAQKPDFPPARINLGTVQLHLGRPTEALAMADSVLAHAPDTVDALVIRGNALLLLQRLPEAVAAYDRVLALKPDHVEALRHRGKALFSQTQDVAALASLEAAAALDPSHTDTLMDLGNVLAKLHRHEAAIAMYDRVIALQPDRVDPWQKKGSLLFEMNRKEEAAPALEKALALMPGHPLLQGGLLNTRMFLCDWTDYEPMLARLRDAIMAGQVALMPFAAQSLIGEPDLQRRIAQTFASLTTWPAPLPGGFPRRQPGEKIRLGYFSADFREHPVAQLMAGVFEHHDRDTFEVIAFAFGPPSGDALRQRIEAAVDRLIDVAHLSDPQIAALARELGIDIAIDLGGYTQNARSRIFACRAAPVQASYIGFLGTMGVDWMDYVVADDMLVPPEQRANYTEKIVYLPWYQANDGERKASDRHFTRAELGLPATGLVLACFNNHYKITPPVFDRWMHLLQGVPDATLYLLVGPEVARRNLRAAAEARGVAPDRVVFADRASRGDYLARYRVVDLFLDTWPCNAGTTASDALLMGVPVLTFAGEAMVGRMAASLLATLELPELIAGSPADYEERAVALAGDPAQLAALRGKVERLRDIAPLFDITRFTRYLEKACRAMHARRIAGLPPEDLRIPR